MRALVVLHVVCILLIAYTKGEAHIPTALSVVTWNLAERTPSQIYTEFMTQHADSDVVVVGVQVNACETCKELEWIV